MADARLAAISSETLSDGSPERRLAAVSVEALGDSASVPERRLAAVSVEALGDGNGPPERRLAALTIEVLTPARIAQPFVGWGTPIATRYMYI